MALKLKSIATRLSPYICGANSLRSASIASIQVLQKYNPQCRNTHCQPMLYANAHTTRSFHMSSARLNKNIINIQDKVDFEKRVLASELPVVVDFHANWCGPCKTLGPRLEAIVTKLDGKVLLANVDVDMVPAIAMDFDIQAIPTVLAIKDGNIQSSFVGLKDDDGLESFVKALTLS